VLLGLGLGLGWLVARVVAGRGWPFTRFVVADLSMALALLPGDRLLLLRWLPRWRPRPGDVVVLRDPVEAGRFLVKRVHAPDPAGLAPPITAIDPARPAQPRYTVRGDNAAASRDSRQFGPISRDLIVGRAVWRYLPGPRRGSVAFAQGTG
jgi:hypothetical protein